MKKKYLSLFLAAVISLAQITGIGQVVQAAEVFGEARQKGMAEIGAELEMAQSQAEKTGQEPETAQFQAVANQEPEMAQPQMETKQGGYELWFKMPVKQTLMIGQETSISRMGQHQGEWVAVGGDGENIPMEITAAVSDGSDVVSLREEGETWQMTAQKVGEATITVTCGAVQDISGDNAAAIKPEQREIHVIVIDRRYELEVEGIPEYALPETNLNLTAKVSAYNEKGQEVDVSDTVVEWRVETQYENVFEKNGTGNSFQIEVPTDKADYQIVVTVEVKKGEEVVDFWIQVANVVDLYYELDEESFVELEEMWPGEVKTVTPKVYRYEAGKEPAVETAAKVQFDYDEDVVEIQKDGEHVEPNAPQDNGSFTIKKLKNDFTSIGIEMYVGEGCMDIKSVSLLRKDYYDISITGSIDHWRDYLFIDDDNPKENDTGKTYTLDTAKLGGDYEIEWTLEADAAPVNPSVYKISGGEGEQITIDAQALKDDLKEKFGENKYDEYDCTLSACVKAAGEEQASQSINLMLTKPSYWIDRETKPVVKGSVAAYKDGKVRCGVRNKDYPSGGTLMLDLKEIEILEQEPEVENTDVFTMKKVGADYLLAAENCGWAKLGYRIVLPGGDEKMVSDNQTVVNDGYKFDLSSSTGTTHLLPGAELKMETEVWHVFYNEQTKMKACEKLAPEKYSVTYSINGQDGIVSVGQDGTVKAVGGSGTVSLTAKCIIPLAGGEEEVEWYEDEITVMENYGQVVAEEISAAPGETIGSVDLEWKIFDSAHKNGMVVPGDFSYQLYDKSGDISLNELGTEFTVNSDALDGRKIRILVYAWKENPDGSKETADGMVTVNVRSQDSVCSHDLAWKILKPATCTEAGTKVLECSKCHNVTETETIPAAGHKNGSWTTTKAATCTEAGSQQQKLKW